MDTRSCVKNITGINDGILNSAAKNKSIYCELSLCVHSFTSSTHGAHFDNYTLTKVNNSINIQTNKMLTWL